MICLQTFEYGLCILKYAGALIEDDIGVGNQLAFLPGSVLVIGNVAVIGLHVTEAER
jgi:hypothetical protein